ncbi:5,10-methenyltetrahydrofolate synthetase [Paraburkholderia fungorum]|uniref:5-formyltetrahydrofolate cyclo-ligase n=1 Tax=Paraburkholderia fungorum TaxID=134537 RepID=UPI000D0679FC|nr:5-formyltetrahydrofolate cyclo-ligase [Paraburkholderia fungorum]PRZ55871.1 5,10-methenyltetrahydrofolate synthetase [Paraburkholderia fungorum]
MPENTEVKIEAKSLLRSTLLARRQAQSMSGGPGEQHRALATRLRKVIAQHQVSNIGFYWPVAGEFDARGLLTEWLASGDSREAALPVVLRAHAPMVFHGWHSQSLMKDGRYRIPVPAEERMVVPELLLIPCVGFDVNRYRLGYGGGYYDRTLAAWPTSNKPVTIGVAFESANCGRLPQEEHDLPLDVVVTEVAIY